MTCQESANRLRRLALAMESLGEKLDPLDTPVPFLDGDAAVAAGATLLYLYGLVQISPRKDYSKEVLLKIIELCGRDRDIFPIGTWDAIASVDGLTVKAKAADQGVVQ